MRFLDGAILILFILVIIAFFAVIITMFVYKSIGTQEIFEVPYRYYNIEAKAFIISISSLVLLIGLVLTCCLTFKIIIKKKVLSAISQYNSIHSSLYVNADKIDSPKAILSAISTVGYIPPHRSSPSHSISVEIRNKRDTIILNLKRDSQDPREYWIFYDPYSFSSNNEIGKIRTTSLDNY